jgi:hypothetical protein
MAAVSKKVSYALQCESDLNFDNLLNIQRHYPRTSVTVHFIRSGSAQNTT